MPVFTNPGQSRCGAIRPPRHDWSRGGGHFRFLRTEESGTAVGPVGAVNHRGSRISSADARWFKERRSTTARRPAFGAVHGWLSSAPPRPSGHRYRLRYRHRHRRRHRRRRVGTPPGLTTQSETSQEPLATSSAVTARRSAPWTAAAVWNPRRVRGSLRAQLDELVALVVDSFPRTLSPVEEDPERTSDPRY